MGDRRHAKIWRGREGEGMVGGGEGRAREIINDKLIEHSHLPHMQQNQYIHKPLQIHMMLYNEIMLSQ